MIPSLTLLGLVYLYRPEYLQGDPLLIVISNNHTCLVYFIESDLAAHRSVSSLALDRLLSELQTLEVFSASVVNPTNTLKPCVHLKLKI